MNPLYRALFAVICVHVLSRSTSALKCVQCTEGCQTTYPEAFECASEFRHCAKMEMYDINGRVLHVHRACNNQAANRPNDCTKVAAGKVCVYTCNTDGCNGVAGLAGSPLFLALLTVACFVFAV